MSQKLSTSSNKAILINPSRDYLRLLIIIYAAILYGLKASFFPINNIMLLIIGTIILIVIFKYQPKPTKSITMISQGSGLWKINYGYQNIEEYQTLEIIYDVGLFMMLLFNNEEKSRQVILFKDQVRPDDIRWLYLSMVC